MKLILRNGSALAALLLTTSAYAQTVPEVEPNSTKATATPVTGIAAGGSITGTSTGTGVTVGDTAVTTVDMFRVKTGALPPGIYLHTLQLTATTAGNAGTIRGLTQTGGAPNPGTDAIAQTNVGAANKWYGFGAQEEIYYRVSGTAASTGAYAATLSTTTIAPVAIAGTFNPGTITVSTQGQGHTSDTELYLFDSNGVQVGHNDDIVGVGVGQSKIIATLTSGTYFVAVGTFNMATAQGDANAGENYVIGTLLDFPNAMLRNETYTTALNVGFSVTDGATTTPVAATLPAALEVVWGTFTVQVNTNPPANDNCANAQAIGSGTFGGLLTFATNDGAASCDPGGAASRDVWFSFTDTLGAGGTLNLDTCGSAADTVLSVYAACGGTELACSDDCGGAPCASTSSCVSLALSPSQSVKIRISDKGLGGGNYTLHSALVLANDSCTTAVSLPGPGIYPFDTTLATTGEGTTSTCSTPPAKDLWYSYTATTNGTLTIDTCNQVTGPVSTDTEIWVYQGAGCPTLPAIACNDDSCGLQSLVSTPITCGAVYMIEVGNYNGQPTANMFGTFTVVETGTQCSTPSTSFCLGDGTGTPCPCSPVPNNGSAGRGCGSLMFPGGALLTSTGIASDETGIGTSDTLVLTASDVPGPALFIQSNGIVSPIAFGDGQLCAAVGIIRLGVVFPGPPVSAANVASYPGGTTPNEIHIQGLANSGDTKHYQAWYRSVPGMCTSGQNYALTQGVSLTWGP